jgi:hypothetical protein
MLQGQRCHPYMAAQSCCARRGGGAAQACRVPLYRDPKSLMPVTQFNMKWVEQAGLVKFDLGRR